MRFKGEDSLQHRVPVQTDSSPNLAKDEAMDSSSDPARTPINYRILALLWVFVSGPAVYLLWRDQTWLTANGIAESVRAIRLEQWVAFVLLGVHGWFLYRASRARAE
jgi:hypothetical protein